MVDWLQRQLRSDGIYLAHHVSGGKAKVQTRVPTGDGTDSRREHMSFVVRDTCPSQQNEKLLFKSALAVMLFLVKDIRLHGSY